MMKKFLYLIIAALALVACGDDDHEENNPPQEKQYTKLVTRANMDISQELLNIADITVYYYYCPLNMLLCRIIQGWATDKPPLKR